MYERYHELLELCFKAKEKGIDVFFNYSPHTQEINIDVYKKGWEHKSKKDKNFYFYFSDYWKDSKEYGPAVALEAIAYINELLTEEEQRC